MKQSHFYEFGEFRLYPEQLHVERAGAVFPLPPKAVETLLILIENNGSVVAKGDLINRLWPDSFVGEDSLPHYISVLRKALGQAPDGSPLIQTMPKRGYRFVASVIEHLEEARQALPAVTPERLVEVREGDAANHSRKTAITAIAPAPSVLDSQAPQARLGIAYASIVGLGLALLLLTNRTVTGTLQPLAPGKVVVRRSVAVLDLHNSSGRQEEAWLATAVSEMLSTELAAGGKVRIIPRENVAPMGDELSLPVGDSLARGTLNRIRANLGTDLVVMGSYSVVGNPRDARIRLDLRVQDTASSEILGMFAETGTESGLFELLSHAGSRLRDRLEIGEFSTFEAEAIRASLPSSSVANRDYAEGLAKLRLFDARSARDLFQKASRAEPRFPLAHARLAEAWSALGYDEKANEEAGAAFDLAAVLSQEQRLSIEANSREMSKDWETALSINRRLWTFFPDDPEYGLRLAETQIRAGRPKDALATVETLRSMPPPLRDDARIDLAESSAAGEIGDLKRSQAAAARAANKAAAIGAQLLTAQALLRECDAIRTLGQNQTARERADEARRIFALLGDRKNEALALVTRAGILRDKSALPARKRDYQEALTLFQEYGYKSGEARALNSLAGVLEDEGDYSGALKGYEESLAIRRAIKDKEGAALALNNIGTVLETQGHLPGAKRKYEESLAVYRAVGSNLGMALTLGNIGGILQAWGDLPAARGKFEESARIFRTMGRKDALADMNVNLAQVLLAEGDLTAAEELCEEAARITETIDKPMQIASIRVFLAEILLEEGRFQEAEIYVRKSMTQFRTHSYQPEEIGARILLARILLELGQPQTAQTEIDAIKGPVNGLGNIGLLARYEILAGRVAAALGRVAEANRILHNASALAQKAALVECQFEAYLALGETEIKLGGASGGKARLAAVRRDATAKSFFLIARKAAALTN